MQFKIEAKFVKLKTKIILIIFKLLKYLSKKKIKSNLN